MKTVSLIDKPELLEAFREFLKVAQGKIDAHWVKQSYIISKPTIKYEEGHRNIRVISVDGDHRSVFCFVDKENGDILKAASWAAPARHARGNVFDADHGASAVEWTGARYLR